MSVRVRAQDYADGAAAYAAGKAAITDPRRTALYNRALEIAKEHGFTLVNLAYAYIKNAPTDDATFTRKERRTIIYVTNQIYGDDHEADTTPQFTNFTGTAASVTTINGQPIQPPLIGAGTLPNKAYGGGTVIHHYRKSAFAKAEEDVKAQIRDYLIDRYAGIPVGVAHSTESIVFINRARNATTYIYNNAADIERDLSALGDAYAITRKGVIATEIDAAAQAEVVQRLTLLRDCASLIRRTILEIDKINARMDAAQTPVKVAPVKVEGVVDGDAGAAG